MNVAGMISRRLFLGAKWPAAVAADLIPSVDQKNAGLQTP
jgi:hypothetical protein